MGTVESYVTVVCPGCGGSRELSPRQARRPGLCRVCHRLGAGWTDREARPEDLLWWFARLTDEELAGLLSDIVEHAFLVENVRAVRLALLAGTAPAGAMLSSVAQPAGACAA